MVWCDGSRDWTTLERGGVGILVRAHRRVDGGARVLSVLIEGRLITLLEDRFELVGGI
jgi:hypothetical protein